MKSITLLIASAGLLLTLAAPVNAHDGGYREYDSSTRYREHDSSARYRQHDSSARYRHYDERRGKMPRWLKRQTSFRAWYKHSRYKQRRAITWTRLFEIYSWEKRQHRHRHRDW
jgi:hypothetical protein